MPQDKPKQDKEGEKHKKQNQTQQESDRLENIRKEIEKAQKESNRDPQIFKEKGETSERGGNARTREIEKQGTAATSAEDHGAADESSRTTAKVANQVHATLTGRRKKLHLRRRRTRKYRIVAIWAYKTRKSNMATQSRETSHR